MQNVKCKNIIAALRQLHNFNFLFLIFNFPSQNRLIFIPPTNVSMQVLYNYEYLRYPICYCLSKQSNFPSFVLSYWYSHLEVFFKVGLCRRDCVWCCRKTDTYPEDSALIAHITQKDRSFNQDIITLFYQSYCISFIIIGSATKKSRQSHFYGCHVLLHGNDGPVPFCRQALYSTERYSNPC